MKNAKAWLAALPWAVAIVCLAAFGFWLTAGPPVPEALRLPISWNRTPSGTSTAQAGGAGRLIPGPGKPSALPGSWPQFRGPARDNLAHTTRTLARAWPAGGPKVLWRIPVGEGHAGAAIHRGRVYLLDYDREQKQDAVRCLSLETGEEIWRYAYPVELKRNHGMSRTVPAVDDRYVVTLGPKCHVQCLDSTSGQSLWRKDLVAECKTTIPPWYAGQCPLIDEGRAILAPGARPLMMAIDLASGRTVWQTRGGEEMGMTHSSIMPFTFKGRKQYVYCAGRGAVGVDAANGRILWTKPDWKINMANVPTPVPVGPDRIFFSGGYDAGCTLVQLIDGGTTMTTREIFRLKPAVFGADQQTPVLYKDHLYGTVPPSDRGELACLDLSGRRLWSSGAQHSFRLGPFLMTADGLFLGLNDQDGTLHLAAVGPEGYQELAKAKILNGHDAWGPMALAEGRLILRDLTEMVCVDVGE